MVDLRSILGALGVDFAGFSLAFRSSGPIRSKKRRLTKNMEKPQENIGKIHISRMSAFARTMRNSIENRYERASRPSCATDDDQEQLLGRSGALLGRSWALLGRSGALLGGSWALLGAKMAR